MKTVGGFETKDTTGPRRPPSLMLRAGLLTAAATLALLTGCSAMERREPTSHPISAEKLPEPTSHATSAEDATNRQSACLRDRGWAVSITDDGAISVSSSSVSEEQLDLYRKDAEQCGEGLLPDPATFDDNQWSEMYTAVMDSADCLAKQGYEAPNRPSLQAFIDVAGDWSPYSEIDTYDFERLEDLCPQAEYWG